MAVGRVTGYSSDPAVPGAHCYNCRFWVPPGGVIGEGDYGYCHLDPECMETDGNYWCVHWIQHP